LHTPLSARLAEILADPSAAHGMTLNALLRRTEGLSLNLIIIVLALPFVVPISVPGLSPIMGSIIVLLALGEAFGKVARLPRALGEHTLPERMQQRLVNGSISFVRLIERLVRPRRSYWMSLGWARLLNSLLVAFLGVLLALPLPSPPFFFSNSIPSYGIIVLAASMMEEDGVLVWFAYALVLVNIIFFSLIGGVVAEFFLHVIQRLSGS
jgi:hypothetical protein